MTDQARAEADATLVVDAGDLLMPSVPPPDAAKPGPVRPGPPEPDTITRPPVSAPPASEIERRARLLFTALARMGVTAFSPGERDLAAGAALLIRLARETKVPIVSANLIDERGRLVFPPHRIVDAAGLKIGIFGLVEPQNEDRAAWRSWKLATRDATETARAEVQALRAAGADLILALVHVGPRMRWRQLLENVSGIDWAVVGHSHMMLDTPELIGKTRVVEAMGMGKQIGRLDLHVVDRRDLFVDRGQRAQVATILADHERQIVDARKRAGSAPEATMKDYYAKRIKSLEEAVAREKALLATLPTEVRGSWFENRIIPLEPTIPDHPAMVPLVARYNDETARLAAAGKPTGVTLRTVYGATPARPAPRPAEEPLRYTGAAACGECHEEELAVWRKTKHAHAVATLARKGRDRDPSCIGCHVTGYMRPGGTKDLAVARGLLRDVGCEACHGPGAAHAQSQKPADIARRVPAELCLGCHTPDQTNGEFEYEPFVKAILGPGHGAPEAAGERR